MTHRDWKRKRDGARKKFQKILDDCQGFRMDDACLLNQEEKCRCEAVEAYASRILRDWEVNNDGSEERCTSS